ncbi:heparan-alpha-glucosaminide N-acetyltransferase [Methanolobus sp.]|uniref:heparan-alpha-glucosaminide N-acetyltransferase n=1 Tax=Methanolobus sp. TaxID=1874737 RepID=UPI0025D66475|nr:heparan-alpha-glucosaminide N-acetyltransferase [Methanolobus sp.]
MGQTIDKTFQTRFWEVDFFRGVAIVLMVIYHLFYDLRSLGIYELDVNSGILLIIGRSASMTFIFLVGLSLTLSYSRARSRASGNRSLFPKYVRRGAAIFSWGLVITFVTGTLLPRGTIFFGILHLIGVSIILAYPFLKFQMKPLFVGLAILFIGFFAEGAYVDFPWLLWLGLRPYGFYSIDYVPLIPWFGLVLLGVSAGNILYRGYRRQFRIRDLENNYLVRLFGLLGRNSLFIYLVHQPLIIGFLILGGFTNIDFMPF